MRGGTQMSLLDLLSQEQERLDAAETPPCCTCATAREKGFSRRPEDGVWVHALCRLPSRLYYERVIRGAHR